MQHQQATKAPKPERRWAGRVPAKDDFGVVILGEFVDGKTRQGPWAFMSRQSYKKHGVGLGMGRGQRYQQRTNGLWVKVEG